MCAKFDMTANCDPCPCSNASCSAVGLSSSGDFVFEHNVLVRKISGGTDNMRVSSSNRPRDCACVLEVLSAYAPRSFGECVARRRRKYTHGSTCLWLRRIGLVLH